MLYAPTFRDNQHDGSGYTYDTHLDFDRLREEFGDEYVILFRAHYFVANQFDFSRYEGFVYDVSALDDITPLYLISDLLITDYSSVFFDYANLKRPVLFYMYDLEQYANDIRGFYFSLDELPGPILKTEDELVDAIRRVEETPVWKYYTPGMKYDTVLSRTRLFVTDYSSIAYDAFYRGASVVFFWKDKDECMKEYGKSAHLMLTEDLAFGDICMTEEELRASVRESYDNPPKQEYEDNYRKIVAFHDGKNTDRFIAMAKKDGILCAAAEPTGRSWPQPSISPPTILSRLIS